MSGVWSNAVNATETGVQTINAGVWTGSALTQYDVLVGGASSAISSVGPGTQYQILQSGGASANPAYSTATYPATTTANDILYSSSNNVVGQITASANGVLISSNSDVPSWLANSGTAGWVLTANTGAPPSWQAVSSGISALNWAINSTASFALAAANGVLATYAGAIAVTLPTSSAGVGTELGISVVNASGVATITLGTGQTIQIGSQTYSTSVASQAQGDTLVLVNTVAASGSAGAWVAISALGNWIGS